MASIATVTFDRGVILTTTVNAITRGGGFDSVNGTSINNTEGQGRVNGVTSHLNSTDPILSAYDWDLAATTAGDYGILTTGFGAGKGTVYGWFYLQYTNPPVTATAILMRLRTSSANLIQMTITTGNLLRLLDGTTNLTPSFTLTPGTLYRVGFQYTKGTGANGIARMWVKSGPADGAFSGTPDVEKTNTTQTADATVFRFGNQEPTTTATPYRVAHIALDDAAMPAVVALPTTYYVATNGSDSNTGLDTAHPFLTVNKAITTAGAGSRIEIRAGTYTENIAHGSAAGVTAGADGKRTVLRNYPGETVWIRGGMRLGTASYWSIRGIGFEWNPALTAGGDPSHMIQIKEQSQYYEIARCRFRNAVAYADLLLSDGGNGWIHHNWFEDTAQPAGHTAHQDHNIYMTSKDGQSGAGGYEGEHHTLIEYNLLTGTPNGRGTKIGAISSGQGSPHHNTIRYNTYYGNYGPSQIQLSFAAHDNIFDHNLFQKPESTNEYCIGYSSGSFLLTGTGNSATNNYGWQCKGVVQTGNAGLVDTSGNVRADPAWDSDYFPSLAALLTSSKPQFGHLLGLTAASGWAFDTTETPTTTSISPTSIEAGSSQFTLTVNGTNFDRDLIDTGNTAIVKWAGTSLTTTFVTATQLTAIVPAALVVDAGTASVTVTNPRGANTSGGQTFTINAPPTDPAISSLSPTSKVAGEAQFTLTVTGTNLSSACTVNFDAVDRTTVFVDQVTLTATIPAAAIATDGAKTVFVKKTGRTDSNSLTFTVLPAAPILTSISPNTKPAGAAQFDATLTGTGFDVTSTARWNGADLTTVFGDSTSLTATVPAADLTAPGGFAVTVNLPTGESEAVTFTVSEAVDPSPNTGKRRRKARAFVRHLVVPWLIGAWR